VTPGRWSGSSIENEDSLAFSLARGIRPIIEVLPLSEAPKAYERMMSGKARFRVVLDAAA
jgi:propanol-preferring alcohol dehydrogenase